MSEQNLTGTGSKMKSHIIKISAFLVIFLFVVIVSFYHSGVKFQSLPVIKLIAERLQQSKSMVSQTQLQRSEEPAITKPPLTGMWTVNAIGRLGNLMGQYATLFALAKLNGHEAYILPEMHNQLSKIFKIRLPVLQSEVVSRISWRNYGLNDWMSPEYRDIKGEYVRLTGYPCSFTFYHHIKDEILREFTFHDFIKAESNDYLAKVRGERQNITFVGIHVRRGDYVNVMPNTWKGVVADKGYLDKAMNYFRDKYANPLFVVTSNGMDWCKENINNSLGDVHFAGDGQEGSPGRDFALLSHCNHTIMTIGTFGIWVGYLVGGETVYLTNYTLPDSPFLNVFKYKAAFLPEWIGIQADLSPLLKKDKQ